jgi:hypothetical protein
MKLPSALSAHACFAVSRPRFTAPRLMSAAMAMICLSQLLIACRASESIHAVDVHATDYAFRLPATLPPGQTAFRLVNDGTVWHEVQVFRFRPGVDRALAARLLAADSLPDAVRDSTGSVLIAGAGLASGQAILVTLAPGEWYGFLCEFRDADAKPKHAKLGMFGLVHVE